MTTKTQKQHSFTLTVMEQVMHVTFTSYRFANYGHFEFHSAYQPYRPIPVSATGYWSHFVPMQEIETVLTPEAYAKNLVCAFIKSTRHDDRQQDLFGDYETS